MTNLIENAAQIMTATEPLDVLGAEVRIFLNGAATNGQYSAYRVTVPPTVGPPPHKHDAFDEAFYVLEGEVELTCASQVTVLKAGSYVFVPRGVVHTFRNASDAPASFLGTCTPAGHEKFFEDADKLKENLTLEAVMELCAKHGIEIAAP